MWRTIKIDVQVGELTLPKILQSEKSFADTSGEWNLILVDRNHYIPNNYQVELTELSNGKKVDSRIYPELQQMFNDARAEGLALFVREGYRTTEEQQKIMDEKINEYEKFNLFTDSNLSMWLDVMLSRISPRLCELQP